MNRVAHAGTALAADIQTAQVPDGFIAIWFLGQASIVLKSAEITVFIDPYFSAHPKRAYPPPLTPEDAPPADWIFCTHNHLDHLDLATLVPLTRRFSTCKVVVPAPFVTSTIAGGIPAAQVFGARVGEPIDGPHLTFVALRAKHEEFEVDVHGDHQYLGYLLNIGGVTVFHSGDTVGFDTQASELAPNHPDVVMLPINGRDWARNRSGIAGNMNYREAIDLAVAAGADLVVPLHYDLFLGNTENPATFVDHLYREAPSLKFKLLAVGERLYYRR